MVEITEHHYNLGQCFMLRGFVKRYKRWNPVHPTYGAFWGMGVGIGCGVGWGPGFGPEAIGYVGAGCGIGFSVGFTVAGFGVGFPVNFIFQAPYNAIMATRGSALELAQSSGLLSIKHFAGEGWTRIEPHVSELHRKTSEKLSSFRKQHLSIKGIDLFDMKNSLPLLTVSASESFRVFSSQFFSSARAFRSDKNN
ncbi:cadmium-induced protein AS8 isoform X1 [Senna tora]|uniref:Cadmium-induced protein AS8 isoform X1 n=1 Tax=Senna tora TaxID=362788 RepID=A0A834W5P2_9FABA|nr:cadmium-induced protein AS8 isoform X1 [Senna tora]